MSDADGTDGPALPVNAVRAIRVTMVGIVLSGIEAVVTAMDTGSLQRRLVQGGAGGTSVDVLVGVAVVSGLVAGAVAVALWLRLIRTIRDGGDWPRVVTRALVAAGSLLVIVGLADGLSVIDAVRSGVWGILIIAVLVLLTIRLVARWT